MEIIIAKILGIYFIAVSITLFYKPQRIKRIYGEIKESESLVFISGMIAIFLGAWIVSVHNVWELAWPVIITVLGWISLIKGFALIAFPGFLSFFGFVKDRSESFFRFLGVFWAVIGLLLLYFSCQ